MCETRGQFSDVACLKVSWAGHSQLPSRAYDNFDGNQLTIYKHSGGNLWDLDNSESSLYPALRTSADVFVLFLGGNDIFLPANNQQFVHPDIIKEKLFDTIRQAKQVASHVYVCLLESRDYHNHRNRRWANNSDYYNRVARSINRLLTRNSRSQGYRTINLQQGELRERQTDGIHFTNAGRRRLYHLVKLAVSYCT